MTTIGKVAYIATWDASQLVKGVMTSRQVFSAQKKIVEAMRTPLERYSIGMDNLKKVIEKYPDVAKHQLQLEKQLEKQYKSETRAVVELTKAERARQKQLDFNRRAEKLSRSMKYQPDDNAWMTAGGSVARGAMRGGAARGIAGVAGGAAAGLAGGLALATVGMAAKTAYTVAREGIPLNQDLERTTASMNVFTGSLAKSAAMMEKMRDLSADTGVSFAGYTQGARTMLQFGVATEDVMPKLREMAIITGGDAERMKSLSLAFAQTTAAGKLMGQEVLQMVNAGWSPFEELSKKLGKSVPELRKEMERGNITAKMVGDAMTAATEAGGRFNGMLEQLEGTSARASDREKAAWESATASAGQMLEPLTGIYYIFSTKIAKEVESLANGMTRNKDIVEQLSAAEQKAEAKREAAAKRQERVDQMRSKRLAAEKRMAQEAAEERKLGMESALDLQVKMAGDIAGEDKTKRFQQILSMLNDANQQMAKADFVAGADPSKIASAYLSSAVEVELQKLDAMEKQAKTVKDRLDAEEKMKGLAKSIDSDMANNDPLEALTRRLTELAVANKLGHITDKQMDFAINQAADESTGGQRSTMKIDSMQSGSQAAYQYLVGVQDRNLKAQMEQEKKQIQLQSVMAETLRRSEAHLAQIADIKMGSDG